MNRAWLSAHLYHYGDVYGGTGDRLLLELVDPVAEMCQRSGWVEKFFFVRYLERGPHIRFRLYGHRDAVEAVRAALVDKAREFFHVHPATRASDDAIRHVTATFARTDALQPNCSIDFEPYEPEVGRYGGESGLGIAEQHFADSSSVVMQALKRLNQPSARAGVSTDERLGVAFLFMVCFVRALTTDAETARRFLIRYSEAYSKPEREAAGSVLAHAYERALASHRESLETQAARFWSSTIGDFPDPLFEHWYQSSRNALRQLRDLATDGRLSPPSAEPKWSPDEIVSHVASSLLHMTSNRLGVTVSEEAYLAFLLSKVIAPAFANRQSTLLD